MASSASCKMRSLTDLRTWRRLRRRGRDREAMLLDLGALVYELHRQGRRAPELLQRKASELGEVDREVRALENAAEEREAPCPHCGEPVESRQPVCLSCGGRVALGERRSPAREPVSALTAVLLAVTVAGAGLFGFAISELVSEGDDGEPRRAAATAPEQSAAAEPQAPAVVGGSEQEAAPAEAPPFTDGPAEPGAVPRWPPDLRAHTVVLVTTSDRPAAIRVARDARATGLEAGLMRSDPYDLGTGLWIVFSGQFTTLAGAQRQAGTLGERYPGAYAQLVSRSQ
jgi:hypothetical protein